MTSRSAISQSNPLILFDVWTRVVSLRIGHNTKGLKPQLMTEKTRFGKVGNYVSAQSEMSLR
jgi:hypothetical protein